MKFSQKNIENWQRWKMTFFWVGHFEFFFSKKIFFVSSPWKLVTNYVLEWMGHDFQYYDGLQPKKKGGNHKWGWVYNWQKCWSNKPERIFCQLFGEILYRIFVQNLLHIYNFGTSYRIFTKYSYCYVTYFGTIGNLIDLMNQTNFSVSKLYRTFVQNLLCTAIPCARHTWAV